LIFIQQYIVEKINETTSMLDLFFRKDITEREKDLKEKEKENFRKKWSKY
jgi:hypothetical protein